VRTLGKSHIQTLLMLVAQLPLQQTKVESKLDNVWFDELTEEPQKVYNKQIKRKAQWKREINPRKH